MSTFSATHSAYRHEYAALHIFVFAHLFRYDQVRMFSCETA